MKKRIGALLATAFAITAFGIVGTAFAGGGDTAVLAGAVGNCP
ncbi:hypothetical protein ACFYU9_02500 [Streptomyces sp. NPDC004327]